MSIRKRLNEKREQLPLSQKKFGKFGRAKNWEALGATGADEHCIVADETKDDRLLAAIKTSIEKIAGLALSDKCKAAIAQLMMGLYVDNIEQIKDALEIIRADCIGLNPINDDKKAMNEAIPDYGKGELTTAEKNLITAYRKASQPDKSLIDRLTQLVERAAENETKSGIAEDVIDGE